MSKSVFFWFYIEPYVYVNYSQGNILFWNTLSFKSLEINNHPYFNRLVRRINNKSNCGVCKVLMKEYLDEKNKAIFDKLKKLFFAELIETDSIENKPISIYPLAKITENPLDDYRKNSPIGADLKLMINELTFFVNSMHTTEIVKYPNTQFLYPISNDSKVEIPLDKIIDTILNFSFSPILYINILGGDLFKYSSIEALLVFLNSIDFETTLFFCIEDFFDEKSLDILSRFVSKKISLKVYITSFNEKVVECVRTLLLFNVNFAFIVNSQHELEIYQNWVIRENIENCSYVPFYNNKNLSFFKKNVFLTKQDILGESNTVNMHDIIRNQNLNILKFGKLVITNNCDVFTSYFERKIGSLIEQSVNEIVYDQFFQSNIWFRVRNQYEPCKKCLYNILCPPVSGYEMALK